MAIEVVNTEQAAAWDGHEGDVWTEEADRYERGTWRTLDRFFDPTWSSRVTTCSTSAAVPGSRRARQPGAPA